MADGKAASIAASRSRRTACAAPPCSAPSALELLGEALGVSRLAAYSAGFFLFWIFAAASSALTSLLQGGR